MALARKLPESFDEALRTAKNLLSASSELVLKNLVDVEAEQLVVGAYRIATGQKLTRAELFFRYKDRFPEAAGQKLLILASARAAGKILQHLLGYQAFLDHEYEVSPVVLVPRPETELLVIRAIADLSSNGISPLLGLEIGTGSGVIAIEMLLKFPKLRMIASEISEDARKIAQRNLEKLLPARQQRLQIVASQSPDQVWEPFAGLGIDNQADFLISNPPYLLPGEAETDVAAHEPAQALFAPVHDPLFFYEKIARAGSFYLREGGSLYLELPPERAQDIAALFSECGWSVRLEKDLKSADRFLIGKSD
jgi:release factor glutamine methyltransferase